MAVPPIANDYASIAKRLAQLDTERRAAKFVLPPGVVIMRYGSDAHLKLNETQLAQFDIAFILRGASLKMVKARSGSFTTSDGVDMVDYLQRYFPSLTLISRSEIQLNFEDTERLNDILKVYGV
jgi:hypothetical protein